MLPILSWDSHILEETVSFGQTRFFLPRIIISLFRLIGSQGDNSVGIGHIYLQGESGIETQIPLQHKENTDDIFIDFLQVHVIAFIKGSNNDMVIGGFPDKEEACGNHVEKGIVVFLCLFWRSSQILFPVPVSYTHLTLPTTTRV